METLAALSHITQVISMLSFSVCQIGNDGDVSLIGYISMAVFRAIF